MAVSSLLQVLSHCGHRVEVVYYGDKSSPSSVTVECLDCGEVLLELNTRGGSGVGLGPLSEDCDKDMASILRASAAEQFEQEGQLEIDDNAVVCEAEDGAYVQAYVYVDYEDVPGLHCSDGRWKPQKEDC